MPLPGVGVNFGSHSGPREGVYKTPLCLVHSMLSLSGHGVVLSRGSGCVSVLSCVLVT
jgi:hypothetical protein